MGSTILSFIINKILVAFIEKLAAYLPEILLNWKDSLKRKERAKAQDAAEKKYEEVKNNPEATDQEKLDAYKKAIGGK